MKPIVRLFAAAVLLSWLSGCTITPEPRPGDPAYAPVSAPAMAPPSPGQGGIYRANYGLSLYEDNRTRRIGDVLTITLTERTVSSKRSNSAISKENEIALDAGTVLGRTPSFHGGDYTMETAIQHNRDFKGTANADQSNNLQGSITVMVSDIMPNGLLEVRGEKWLTLNRGEEFVRLRGYERPEDILADNSVPSTRVADVRITYSGTGELADASRQGWLARFFSSPYWPF